MQNFGKLKNIYNSLLIEGIANKDKKKSKLFKEYVKAIKNNEILKTQFLVYNNIEEKVELNEYKASEFIKANIELLSKYSKDEIYEANKLLSIPLLVENKLPLDYNGSNDLHNDISTLIFTKKNPKTIDKIVESLTNVISYIQENTIKEVNDENPLPNSILSNIVVDKYNDRYSNLTEDEKNVLKTILESDEESRKLLYNKISRDCIELVDENLTESDIEAKEKLLAVKDRLLRLEYSSDSFIGEISKLIELKKDLK